MKKKLLVAVDDSIHSKNAIRYACHMFKTVKDLNFTLFHVQPMISQYLIEEAERDSASKSALKEMIDKNTQAGQKLLEKCKGQMINSGVDERYIEVITLPRMMGLAKDILKYSYSDIFDAIIIGRRGLSGLQETIMGSVSSNVIEHSEKTPVWLVDGEVESSKIMFAVDGSENSLKAVDHIAFMMGNHPDIRILFFHVQPKISDFCPVDFESTTGDRIEEIILRSDKKCVDQFFAHAMKKLKSAGFEDNQIDVKVSEAVFNPGKAIMNEAHKGNYGTIVMGRRGINKTFFMGSVSRYVINQISNQALWIVP